MHHFGKIIFTVAITVWLGIVVFPILEINISLPITITVSILIGIVSIVVNKIVKNVLAIESA